MSKVVLAVGGTGGHIVPALECARHINCETYFIGVKAKQHHLLENVPRVVSVDGSTITLNSSILFSLKKILKGFFSSLTLLKKIRPQIVVGFGSYHSLPPLLAAFFLRIPIVLYEPNAKMGRVNRLFSPIAVKIAMYFPGSQAKMVAMPINPAKRAISKEQARLDYGLSPDIVTLLVFGGSQGAQILNQVVPFAVMGHHLQVIHLAGFKDSTEQIRTLYEQHGIKAIVKSFEEDMAKAYLSSDLVICRSGAGTLREIISSATPAIVVPYPHATDDHQTINAKYFTDVVRGGISIQQKEFTPELVSSKIQKMLSSLHHYQSHLTDFQVKEEGDSLATVIQQFIKVPL